MPIEIGAIVLIDERQPECQYGKVLEAIGDDYYNVLISDGPACARWQNLKIVPYHASRLEVQARLDDEAER